MAMSGAKGGATETTAHWVCDREVLKVHTLDVVAIPSITFVPVIGLMFYTEGRAAGTAEPLALDRDCSASRVVADKLTWSPLRAEASVLVTVLGTDTLTTLAGEVGPQVAVSGAALDVTLAADSEGGAGLATMCRRDATLLISPVGLVACKVARVAFHHLRHQVVALDGDIVVVIAEMI